MTRSLVLGVVATLAVSSCGAQAAKVPSATPRHVALTVMDTTPPPGVNVPGAHWIKIVGAGGVSTNEQIAAVFRPAGPGPFPLVVELHGALGLKDVDVEFAAQLAAAGLITIARCLQASTIPTHHLHVLRADVDVHCMPKALAGRICFRAVAR